MIEISPFANILGIILAWELSAASVLCIAGAIRTGIRRLLAVGDSLCYIYRLRERSMCRYIVG